MREEVPKYIRNEESQVHIPTYYMQKAWMANLAIPCRVGMSGFQAQSVWTILCSMGMLEKQRRAAVKAFRQATERASSWLWVKRRTRELISNEG